MILEKTPISLAEVKVKAKHTENQALKEYLDKFTVLSEEKAHSLIKELKSLDSIKLKEEHIIKIADFLPKDAEDLNKIMFDVPLTEEESNAILEIVKKY